MNTNRLSYEHIFLDNNKKMYARIYNSKLNKSKIKKIKEVVPELYIEYEKGSFSAFDNQKRLERKDFKSIVQRNSFIRDNKDKTIYGYKNQIHKYIRDNFPEPKESFHDIHTWFIDIETRSGTASYPDSTIVKTKYKDTSRNVYLKEIRENEDLYVILDNNQELAYKESKYSKPISGFPHAKDANEEVTVIQIYDSVSKKYYVLGRKDYTDTYTSKYGEVKYINCKTEETLLNMFMKLLDKQDPAILVGFNSLPFDFPYLTHRIWKLGLDVSLLSPVREVKFKNKIAHHVKDKLKIETLTKFSGEPVEYMKSTTKDGMEYETVQWTGRYLLDYRELFLKYGFAPIPSVSLKAVAEFLKIISKVDNSEFETFDGSYSGEGYKFPDEIPTDQDDLEMYSVQVAYRDNPTQENLDKRSQVVFNKFMKYSIRDVEVMIEMDNVLKFIDTTKNIAYTCGVNIDEVFGTLKQWQSFVYNTAIKKKTVVPLEQQYAEKEVIYKAGWTAFNAGKKWKWVASFDFSSLYPSIIRAFNIGTDTMIKPEDLPQDAKRIRDKLFTFYSNENFGYPDTEPDGKHSGVINKKYKNNTNDTIEETEYFLTLLKNEELMNVLKKYNYSITANGIFHTNEYVGVSPELMGRIFNDRIIAKRKAQSLEGEMQKVPKDSAEYRKLEIEKDAAELESNTLKILMNSQYGAQAMKVTPFSSGKLSAAAITTSGRIMNKLCGLAMSNKIHQILGEEPTVDLTYIAQADTDSVVSSTLIYKDGKKVQIGDFYEDMLSEPGKLEKRSDNNYIKHINSEIFTKSLNKDGIVQEKRIKYVMKHLVKKRMYKINYNPASGNDSSQNTVKEVIVTEDHSCIIYRDGKYISVKPKDIVSADSIILLEDTRKANRTTVSVLTKHFTVEDLGVQEQFVYDIEVEDNHNFFANDICVHNSVYVILEKIVDKLYPNHSEEDTINFILKFIDKVLQPTIQKTINEIAQSFNIPQSEVLNMENEIIADEFVSVVSKRYFCRVLVNDGNILAKPKMKVTGISTIEKGAAPKAKELLKPVLEMILDKDVTYLQNYIAESKKEFRKASIHEVSRITGVSDATSYQKQPDGKWRKYVPEKDKWLTAPIASKGSLVHNSIIDSKKLDNRFNKIQDSEKVKSCYLIVPNPVTVEEDFIAFKDDRFISELEIDKYFDYDLQFEKNFTNKIALIVKSLNWDLYKTTDTLDEW